MASLINVRITSMLHEEEINRWCDEQFGKRKYYGSDHPDETEHWTSYYDFTNGPLHRNYEFQREEDATLFILRWK